jgi:CubicO group peptidase (beta-lactamase class C family)
MHKIYIILILVFLAFSDLSGQSGKSSQPVSSADGAFSTLNITEFEKEIEILRVRYHIPGLSAGIVKDGQLAWKKGFGFADIENKIVPDENTVYQIASLSKTFGSILLMQQVEAGKANLNDPIAKYNIDLGGRWGSDERIKVIHLLTHTAMGNSWNSFKPGYSFRYNGDWYNKLQSVIEISSGKSYGELFMENIVKRLGLKNTVPSTDDSVNFKLTGYNKEQFMSKVARPYDWVKNELTPVQFKYIFGPAAGIMSSVADLAVYAIAIDDKKFLKPETWSAVFTPFVTPKGKTIQYGLGWFVKYYNDEKVVWHTGWWTGYSALLIKIPDRDLTFIILANSQDLSRPFYHLIQPGKGFSFPSPFRTNLNNSLLASDFARVFLYNFADELLR